MPTNYEKCTFRIEEKLINDIRKISSAEGTSQNQVIETALKVYRDYHYMEQKATIVNQEIYNMLAALLAAQENRINNRTNQVLSATAIELGVLTQVIAQSLGISPEQLEQYRKNSVDFIKANQRILRLSEVVE